MTAKIAAALAKAQTEMGSALKQSNNLAYRSKYADLGNVIDACLPALNANGIAVIQPIGEDEIGKFVETVFIHVSGETLSCRVPLIVGKNDMQGFGSAVTYARRYGLMAMAGIAPEDDDGNAAVAAKPDHLDDMEAFTRKVTNACIMLEGANNIEALKALFTSFDPAVRADAAVVRAKDARKAQLE